TAELAALREDLAPAWLAPPLPVEQTAQRYLRPALRGVFVDMVRGSAMDYLDRFGFCSPTVVAMYAVTDGSPGLTGSPWSPGSGHNLLVHNMCRQPGADGTWMVVRGGMGTVTAALARAAVGAGARIRTGTEVARVLVDAGTTTGVSTVEGEEVRAGAVLVATDPFRLTGLAGEHLPADLTGRLAEWELRSPGQTMKLNLALSGLPRFAALAEDRGQYGTTVHLLPPVAEPDLLPALRAAFDDAAAGRLPATPPIEWYLHSTLDPSLQDSDGNHSSALFVQGVPHDVTGSSWDVELPGYVERLLDVLEIYAPGTRGLVLDTQALAPPDLKTYFGISSGNIHHVNNTFAFTERMPYATGLPGLYAGAAGCHPAGSVIGCAGHNAARLMLSDLGR
ncbi:MAG TPA: FAD-dependent oxidoreductase, partial [Mycobacteriales bacterium]|nr:FAD-dependent oxidoreductase [Mycobacteriales bacterium]